MLRRHLPAASRWPIVAALVATAAVLSACAPTATPAPAASPSVQPTVTGAPTAPQFMAEGTADDNLPIFTEVTAGVWAGDQRAAGRAYVDALVAVGFDKGTMQVTQDLTTVGNPVESLQFSVAWGDGQCLVGQVGPSTGDPVTTVLPQLAEGRCLVGTTRPIDW